MNSLSSRKVGVAALAGAVVVLLAPAIEGAVGASPLIAGFDIKKGAVVALIVLGAEVLADQLGLE
jgi:hypothetical protein